MLRLMVKLGMHGKATCRANDYYVKLYEMIGE